MGVSLWSEDLRIFGAIYDNRFDHCIELSIIYAAIFLAMGPKIWYF